MGQTEFKNKAYETFPALFVIFFFDDMPNLVFAESLLTIDASLGLKFGFHQL